MDIVVVLLTMLSGLLMFALYRKANNRTCKSKRRLDGKTCLVTGGTTGIGLQIAIDFAIRGARVIVACPFDKEGAAALKTIVEESGNDNVVFKHLDLSSLDSVRQFSKEFLKSESRLDILMNNAGVGVPQKSTADGMNIIMQVNYFGHFLLTVLLLPLLRKSGTAEAPSRIVNTTSILHRVANLNVDNLNPANLNVINRIRVYGNSKLALLLFSRELARKLKGSHVVINDADPSEAATMIYASFNYVVGVFLNYILVFVSKSAWEGAQTPILLALDERTDFLSGTYFRNCQKREPSKRSRDDDLAKIMWEKSVKIVKLTDAERENIN